MRALKKVIIGAALVAALGSAIHETCCVSHLRAQLRVRRHQEVLLASQTKRWRSQFREASYQLEVQRKGNLDLHKRLGQLGQPRTVVQAATRLEHPTNSIDSTVHEWLRRIQALQGRLARNPKADIPELRYLSSLDWLEIAAKSPLKNDTDYRKALGELRNRAENLIDAQFRHALQRYMEGHDGRWPTKVAQLKPYFSPPVPDAVLQRWTILPSSTFPNQKFAGNWVLTEKAPVDEDYDQWHRIDSPSSGSSGLYHPDRDAKRKQLAQIQKLLRILKPVMKAYSDANDGRKPRSMLELQAFAKTPDQRKAFDELLRMWEAKMAKR